jgi:hypothetical protein
MSRQDVFEMPFEKVYQCLVQKAERKGRTKKMRQLHTSEIVRRMNHATDIYDKQNTPLCEPGWSLVHDSK